MERATKEWARQQRGVRHSTSVTAAIAVGARGAALRRRVCGCAVGAGLGEEDDPGRYRVI
jgi:hypothetical protein